MAAPSNDNFANAIDVGISSPENHVTLTGSGINEATRESGEITLPIAGGHSVWYKVTPSVNCWIEASTNNSGFDTTLAIFTSLGAAPDVSDDDAGGWNCGGQAYCSWVKENLTSGTTYYIQLDCYGGGDPTVSGTPFNDGTYNLTGTLGNQYKNPSTNYWLILNSSTWEYGAYSGSTEPLADLSNWSPQANNSALSGTYTPISPYTISPVVDISCSSFVNGDWTLNVRLTATEPTPPVVPSSLGLYKQDGKLLICSDLHALRNNCCCICVTWYVNTWDGATINPAANSSPCQNQSTVNFDNMTAYGEPLTGIPTTWYPLGIWSFGAYIDGLCYLVMPLTTMQACNCNNPAGDECNTIPAEAGQALDETLAAELCVFVPSWCCVHKYHIDVRGNQDADLGIMCVSCNGTNDWYEDDPDNPGTSFFYQYINGYATEAECLAACGG